MKIQIFQLYYNDISEQHVDRNICEPIKNNKDHHLREWPVMKEIHDTKNLDGVDVYGFISWKFKQKTGQDPIAFYKFIENNPGFDCYGFSPFKIRHVWQHAEHCHPGIIRIINESSMCLGEKSVSGDVFYDKEDIIYCNYIAGTRDFWNNYFNYYERYHITLNLLSEREPIIHKYHTCHLSGIQKDHGLYPYITERLIIKYLNENKNIKRKII